MVSRWCPLMTCTTLSELCLAALPGCIDTSQSTNKFSHRHAVCLSWELQSLGIRDLNMLLHAAQLLWQLYNACCQLSNTALVKVHNSTQ